MMVRQLGWSGRLGQLSQMWGQQVGFQEGGSACGEAGPLLESGRHCQNQRSAGPLVPPGAWLWDEAEATGHVHTFVTVARSQVA